MNNYICIFLNLNFSFLRYISSWFNITMLLDSPVHPLVIVSKYIYLNNLNYTNVSYVVISFTDKIKKII